MRQVKQLGNMDPTLKRAIELCYKDTRSSRAIAANAGVSPMTLSHWRTRGGTQLSTLTAVLGALGYELKIVKIEEK